jgi:transcriptional regulator with XRE-family HTH domain
MFDPMTRTPPTRQVVAAEVRAAMARADVNQVTLAEAIGISRAGLSERLNSIRPFNTDHLNAIADYLGIDVFTLMVPPASHKSEAATA